MQQAADHDEQVPDAVPMTEAGVVDEKNDPYRGSCEILTKIVRIGPTSFALVNA